MFCLSVHRRCMHNTRCSLILCIIGPSIERSLNQSKCVLRSQPGKVKQKIVALLVFLFLNSAGRMLSSLRRRWYVINESNAGDKWNKRNRLNIKRTPSFGFICSEIYYYITQISTSMKSRAYKTLLAVYEHYAQTENLFAIELSPSHRFHLGLRMLAKLRKINIKLITLRRFRSNADTIPQIIY